MKKMRFVILLGLALLAAWGVPAFSVGADVYRYISAGDLKAKLESGEPPVLIDLLLPGLQVSGAPIVIVCPRPSGPTTTCSQGVGTERLQSLEKGQEGWPYPELTESAGH